MADRRTVAFELLGIADKARRITAEPWLHEDELEDIYDALNALDIHGLEPDGVDPWQAAMLILERAVRLLIGMAQVELSAAGDAASRLWTESKRRDVEVQSRPVRSLLTGGADDVIA